MKECHIRLEGAKAGMIISIIDDRYYHAISAIRLSKAGNTYSTLFYRLNINISALAGGHDHPPAVSGRRVDGVVFGAVVSFAVVFEADISVF